MNCRSCSTALRWVRRLKPVFWSTIWAGAVLIGVGQGTAWTGIGLILSLIAALGLRQADRCEEGLTVGNGQAPRNKPERA